jgi:type II secretory pathway predicted ATPase ExeA/septal ring-binding cell division protein DamX
MTMYLQHFGLREAPFRITPHTEFFFSGANRGATLEALMYAITAGEGMVKVTGEVGSGKTMLCRVLMERLPGEIETIYLAVPSLTRDEMLAAIAVDLGIDTAGANTTRLVRALQERLIEIHSEGRSVVALIDEAHAMPLSTLEEIRLLSNLETEKEKLLQIVLFGQPELDAHLALPNMRQLKERITHSFNLAPLPAREVSDYVRFRLRAAGYHGPDLFGPEALRIIADASEGLTRRINIYADKTLLAAFAAGTHTVTADHARAAVTDTQIVMARRESPRRLAGVAALGIAAGVAIGFGLAHFVAPPSPGAAVAASPAARVAKSEPAAPAAAEPVVASTAPATAALSPIQVASVRVAPPAGAAEKSVARDPVGRRVAAGRELLADTSGPRYAVQLMVTDARERAYLESYLAEAGRSLEPERLYLVAQGTSEAPRLGLVFGTFGERDEALAALEQLPTHLRQFRPYVRTLEALREEQRRAEGS